MDRPGMIFFLLLPGTTKQASDGAVFRNLSVRLGSVLWTGFNTDKKTFSGRLLFHGNKAGSY